MRLNRRGFLTLAGAGVAGATGLYTWRIEPHQLEIVRRALPIRALPPALAGRTLVQISDIHVGLRVADDYVLTTFRRVAELRPDIVVMTGDFVSHHAGTLDQVRAIYPRTSKGASPPSRCSAITTTVCVVAPGDRAADRRPRPVARHHGSSRNDVREVEGLQIAGLDAYGRISSAPTSPAPARSAARHGPEPQPQDTRGPACVGGYEG